MTAWRNPEIEPLIAQWRRWTWVGLRIMQWTMGFTMTAGTATLLWCPQWTPIGAAISAFGVAVSVGYYMRGTRYYRRMHALCMAEIEEERRETAKIDEYWATRKQRWLDRRDEAN